MHPKAAVHPKAVALAVVFPQPLCLTALCVSVLLFHLPCPSSVSPAQGRGSHAYSVQEFFVERRGGDFMLSLIINNITR